jgi:dTDP-D-glucose 4,6-dehydratase
MLNWSPRWDFSRTVKETVGWYKAAQSDNFDAKSFTQMQINDYLKVN